MNRKFMNASIVACLLAVPAVPAFGVDSDVAGRADSSSVSGSVLSIARERSAFGTTRSVDDSGVALGVDSPPVPSAPEPTPEPSVPSAPDTPIVPEVPVPEPPTPEPAPEPSVPSAPEVPEPVVPDGGESDVPAVPKSQVLPVVAQDDPQGDAVVVGNTGGAIASKAQAKPGARVRSQAAASKAVLAATGFDSGAGKVLVWATTIFGLGVGVLYGGFKTGVLK